MMIILEFCIPLLYTLLISNILSKFFKTETGNCIPFAYMLSSLILYISCFFGYLKEVFIVLCIIASMSLFFLLYELVFKKKKPFFSFKVLIYITIYIFVFIITFNKGFSEWDEFSHWGPMIKETLNLNSFYTESVSSFAHHDYPPIVCLLEYLWCRFSGGFQEYTIYRCLTTFGLSLFVPFINISNEIISKNKLILIFISSLFIISFNCCTLSLNLFFTAYIDAIIALLFAYGLALLFFTKDIFKVRFSILFTLYLCFYILTKQVAIFFIAILILLVFVKMFFQSIFTESTLCIKKIVISFIYLVIPFLSLLLWNNYVSSFDGISNGAQFKISDIKFNSFLSDLLDINNPRRQVIVKFFQTLIVKGNLRFNTSYLMISFLSCFILYIILKTVKKELSKSTSFSYMIVIPISLALYAAMMLMLYCYSFDDYESSILTSYERYMGTIVYGVFSFIFIIIEMYNHYFLKNLQKTLIILFLIFMLVPSENYYNFYRKTADYTNKFSSIASMIETNTLEYDKILIIDQGGNGYNCAVLNYMTSPRIFNYLSLYDEAQNTWGTNYNYHSLFNFFTSYDYLLICRLDDYFVNQVNFDFKINDYLEKNQLYRIVKKDGNLIDFELINN